ncbi:MAG: hypothetical protein J6P65_04465 [Bacteroidales bacterium]|nr:hypothetical protein [Bacteroidales bacterium]
MGKSLGKPSKVVDLELFREELEALFYKDEFLYTTLINNKLPPPFLKIKNFNKHLKNKKNM